MLIRFTYFLNRIKKKYVDEFYTVYAEKVVEKFREITGILISREENWRIFQSLNVTAFIRNEGTLKFSMQRVRRTNFQD